MRAWGKQKHPVRSIHSASQVLFEPTEQHMLRPIYSLLSRPRSSSHMYAALCPMRTRTQRVRAADEINADDPSNATAARPQWFACPKTTGRSTSSPSHQTIKNPSNVSYRLRTAHLQCNLATNDIAAMLGLGQQFPRHTTPPRNGITAAAACICLQLALPFAPCVTSGEHPTCSSCTPQGGVRASCFLCPMLVGA